MFVLELTYLVSQDELSADKPAHLDWLRKNIDSGIILTAGPRTDAPGGVIVTGETDKDAVTEMIESDPWVVAGLVQYSQIEFKGAYAAPGIFPRPHSGEMTLINVALTDDPDASLDALGAAVAHVSRSAPGFLGSRLLRSTLNDSIVNFARWNSQKQFEAIFADDDFTELYSKFSDTTTDARFRLYETAHIISPDTNSPASLGVKK